MRFQYLGTAAAEGFPAIFCNCEYCQNARRLKGKNIRTRSQAIIDEKLLLDFPADTYYHVFQYGLDLSKVKYVLFTHSHIDHCSIDDITMRGLAYAHNMAEKKVYVYGNEAVKKKFDKAYNEMYQAIKDCYEFILIKEYEKLYLDEYVVTPIRARHMKNENCFIYLIQKGNKSILYANDTGYLYEDAFEYLLKNKIRLDFVSLDCTMVNNPIKDTEGHMGFDGCNRVALKLKEMGVVDENTQIYVNHFSHNGNPLQDNLEKIAAPFGLKVSFDGLEIELV